MPSSASTRPNRASFAAAISAAVLCSSSVLAQTPAPAANQTVPGVSNAQAIRTAEASPLVRSAYEFLVG